jgi:crossover junction endodeoxyribonuclease RuvC
VRVLGIDPGSRFLGYGLVDVQGSNAAYGGHGVVRTDASQPLAYRLVEIFDEVRQVIARYRPQVVAVEGVFTSKNARSALILGHARGVALLLAAQAGLPIYEYAPAQVKRSVGAGGNDSKGSVARMVTALLDLRHPLERADAYDALAVALCHAHQVGAPFAAGTAGGSGDRRGSSDAATFRGRLSPAFVPRRETGR